MTVQQLVDGFNQAATNCDPAEMLHMANELLKRDPNNADYLALKLQALDSAGRLTEDLGLIQKYILAKSTNVAAFILLYKAYIKRGKIYEALISLTFALSVDPENTVCQKLQEALLAEINPKYTHVRINIMTMTRIGHLCMEIEPWARARQEQEMGCLYLFISSTTEYKTANSYLYNLLTQVAHIVDCAFFYSLYLSRPLLLSENAFAEFPYDIHTTLRGVPDMDIQRQGNINLNKIYRNHPPCLTIPETEKKQGWDYLNRFGIRANDKIVCLHVRDSAYLDRTFPSRDWSYHDYRDADITSYEESIEYLIKKGYKIVRLGNETNQELQIISNSYIDLCINRDPFYGDFIELFLLSECAFFIGNFGGLYGVAPLFDTPIIIINGVPVQEPYSKYSNFIPKLLFKNNEIVSLVDICNGKKLSDEGSKPIKYSTGKDLAAHGYHYENNSPKDILRAVSEFEKRVQKDHFDVEPKSLQLAFRDAVANEFCNVESTNLICNSFLEDHPQAFPELVITMDNLP
ncbi:TIGR04372 family glycosyltransferase [bacterium]|nr:TIGR04372 family glycosyltransferase [bacterium]